MLTLWCIPCAGGSASLYQPWARALAPALTLRVLELPGRGRRISEPLIDDYPTLLELLSGELAAALDSDDAPYALFGHSMGGLLAQGIARRLPALSARAPRALMVSACAAPAARQWSPPDESDAALIASLRRQGGTDQAVFDCPELLEMVLPVLRADYRVCHSFRAQPGPLPMPIHVFGGLDDAVPAASLHAWQADSAVRVTIDWFAGGHFYLQAQQHALLERIVHYLIHERHVARPASLAAADYA